MFASASRHWPRPRAFYAQRLSCASPDVSPLEVSLRRDAAGLRRVRNLRTIPPMRITQLTVAEALASLRSSERGLDSAEAARRLVEFGPNRGEGNRGGALVVRFAAAVHPF